MTGIIIKGIGSFYYIRTEDKTVYECKARGIFRKEKIIPMIGDRVEIDVKNGKGSITKILKRTTSLVRPPVANIDTLVVVAAAESPSPNTLLIDKMLVNAHIAGINPIICINKTDLNSCDDLYDIYKKAGYTVIRTSAEKNEGIDDLMDLLIDKVTAFSGMSGVGKSSLLRHITGMELETGEVSEKIQRGRHTTRHVELIELANGGFVLDTPGFGSLEPNIIKAKELQDYFPEMDKYINGCKFRGCSHINEPDCAVKTAVSEGEISESRYESYKQIFDFLKDIKDWK